ncbi:MAG: PAS domain S-box protein [Syntrophales bacterium LBB04]|nr:PAS domain S-box protein [Syntrophales bacterium LBB04]
MNALQFFSAEEWQRVGENIGKVIQGIAVTDQEYTFVRKDGSTFIGLTYSSPKIHQNKTVGIRGAMNDITERKSRGRKQTIGGAFAASREDAGIRDFGRRSGP